MHIISDTATTLVLVTGSSVSTDWVADYVDHSVNTFSPLSAKGNIATAATTTIVAAPASGVTRQVKSIKITNRHASSSQTVQIFENASAVNYAISQNFTLLAGQCVLLNSDGWTIFNPFNQVIIATGKIFTVNSTLTFAGTDGTTMTFPSTSASLARIDTGQTFNGSQVFNNADVVINYGAGSSFASLYLRNDSGTGIIIQPVYTAGTKYNWRIDANMSADQSYSISPSTTVGGSTFTSNASLSINGANHQINTKGKINIDDTTEATTTTDGSVQTDGGLSVVKKAYIGSSVSCSGVFSTFSTSDVDSTTTNRFRLVCTTTVNSARYGVAMSIGETSSNASPVIISNGVTNTGYWIGCLASAIRDLSTDLGTLSDLRAMQIDFGHGSNNGGTTTTLAQGLYIRPFYGKAGSILTASNAIRIDSPLYQTATVPNSRGISIGDMKAEATNGYAIQIDNQTAGGYAFYSGIGLVKIGDTTACTAPTNGALVVGGGGGFGGAIYATTSINVRGTSYPGFSITDTTDGGKTWSFNHQTGAATLSITENSVADWLKISETTGNVYIASTTVSTTTATGALRALGGIATGDYFTGKHRSSDGTAGLTATKTFYAASSSGGSVNVLNTVTIKDGIITSWVQA